VTFTRKTALPIPPFRIAWGPHVGHHFCCLPELTYSAGMFSQDWRAQPEQKLPCSYIPCERSIRISCFELSGPAQTRRLVLTTVKTCWLVEREAWRPATGISSCFPH
jgi:hypothetical protein